MYERLRARAMVMLLRHTALRISDVSHAPEGRCFMGRRQVHLARFRSHPEDGRAGVPAHSRRD